MKCSQIDTESKVTNNHGPKQDGPNRDEPECRAQMGRAQWKGPNGAGPNGYSSGPKLDGPNWNVTVLLLASETTVVILCNRKVVVDVTLKNDSCASIAVKQLWFYRMLF